MSRLSLPYRGAMRAYDLLWGAASPLLRRNKRLADGYAQRLVPENWLEDPADIWIQAASGGEARLACALADASAGLRPDQPPLNLLATTWTRQGLDLLERHARTLDGPVRLVPRFVPLDAPRLMRRALHQARPRLVVLLETEMWPGLLQACAESRVPVIVLNGRLRECSVRNYLRLPGLWRALAPTRIGAMSADDARRFSRVFPETPVEVFSNIKFDQAGTPVSEAGTESLPPAARDFLKPGPVPLLLLGSVREEEEDALCHAWAEAALPPQRLVIAPRHMHRCAAWQNRLSQRGLAFALRSQLDTADPAVPEIVIWDIFGELPALYQAADAVFVGGSLAPLGGQNFLEALAAGLKPFTGPHIENFAWALDGPPGEQLTDTGLLALVPDAASLFSQLRDVLAKGPLPPAERARNREQFQAWLAGRQGGTRRQAAIMLECAGLSPKTL